MLVREYYNQFEALVRRLLIQMGYDVVEDLRFDWQRRNGPQADFVVSKEEKISYAEVKWTRNTDVPLNLLRDWAAQTARYRRDEKHAVLIASGHIEPSRQRWAEKEFNIEIWDRDFLLAHASGTELLEAFQDFFVSFPSHSPPQKLPVAEEPPEVQATERLPEDAPEFPRGQQLANRLTEIPTGRDTSTEFERVCEEIIDYLFGDSLTDARRQSRLDDGLSILDIVYRVKSQNPFWAALARDFRARVIVFECKNYEGPVGPMQVFTTERYMSAVALRSVCFVLSRTPAHPHAKVAAQGAMRETGKLVIFLDDEILKSMLNIRDAQVSSASGEWDGNSPSEILDQQIYDFLATMPR